MISIKFLESSAIRNAFTYAWQGNAEEIKQKLMLLE